MIFESRISKNCVISMPCIYFHHNDTDIICSMHITLSMLASSASEKSITQKQLLQVLGRTKNLEHLEKYYETTLTDYEVGTTDFIVI